MGAEWRGFRPAMALYTRMQGLLHSGTAQLNTSTLWGSSYLSFSDKNISG